MKKILYHGSEHIIQTPIFGKGALTNDYGRGFYCTESIELAKEWACSKNTSGYANQYEFDMENMSVLNLNDEKYTILTWLAILADNFVSNTISLRQLDNAMRLGKLGEQIVLKSQKAFEGLRYLESFKAEKEEYFAKKNIRDKEARKEYRRSKQQEADVNDIFMLDIMREGMTSEDKRLR